MTRPDFYTIERRNKYNREYYKKNRAKKLAQMKKYRSKNSDVLNKKARDKYRAKVLGNLIT